MNAELGILEAATEKRRGRPAVIVPELKSLMKGWHPGLGDRALANRWYGMEALKALGINNTTGEVVNQEFEWLAPSENERALKHGLLQELGRLAGSHGHEAVVQVATLLCDAKPSVKAGEKMIRQIRLGTCADATTKGLVKALCKTVDGYRAERQPTLPYAQILDALNEAYSIVSRLAEKAGQ